MTAKDLATLNQFFGEDCRQHPEWKSDDEYTNYIDLELTKDFSGIQWNGAEKTYGMVNAVNIVIREMQKTKPNFKLKGKMLAQGEGIGDVWTLVIGEDGFAHEVKTPPAGEKVECPHCGKFFFYEPKK